MLTKIKSRVEFVKGLNILWITLSAHNIFLLPCLYLEITLNVAVNNPEDGEFRSLIPAAQTRGQAQGFASGHGFGEYYWVNLAGEELYYIGSFKKLAIVRCNHRLFLKIDQPGIDQYVIAGFKVGSQQDQPGIKLLSHFGKFTA